MLNGIDPLFIFQFANLLPDVSALLTKVPVISSIPTVVEEPPIPIYLSERLTGLFIDTESKNVNIETSTESKSDGGDVDVKQKAISNTVSISLKANKNSIGLTLLSAMVDKVFEKVTSREYSITYMHGATTVFRGQLHGFSVDQNADDDLMNIRIEITKGQKQPEKVDPTPQTPRLSGAQVLNNG